MHECASYRPKKSQLCCSFFLACVLSEKKEKSDQMFHLPVILKKASPGTQYVFTPRVENPGGVLQSWLRAAAAASGVRRPASGVRPCVFLVAQRFLKIFLKFFPKITQDYSAL